jgi:hypothetical protein
MSAVIQFLSDDQGHDLIEYTLLSGVFLPGFGSVVHQCRRQRVRYLDLGKQRFGRIERVGTLTTFLS